MQRTISNGTRNQSRLLCGCHTGRGRDEQTSGCIENHGSFAEKRGVVAVERDMSRSEVRT